MSDARFPERWLNDRRIRRLSPAAFRTLVVGYVWSVANRTDGLILADDVELMPMFDTGQVDELLSTGLAQQRRDGWFLPDYESTQSSRAELDRNDKLRVAERDRKRRERAHKAGDHTHCPPDKGCQSSSDQSDDPLSAGQLQDRTGQASDRTGSSTYGPVEFDSSVDDPAPKFRPADDASETGLPADAAGPPLAGSEPETVEKFGDTLYICNGCRAEFRARFQLDPAGLCSDCHYARKGAA